MQEKKITEKRKRGRKKLGKTASALIRMRPSDLATIDQACALVGQTRNDYMLHASLQRAEKDMKRKGKGSEGDATREGRDRGGDASDLHLEGEGNGG